MLLTHALSVIIVFILQAIVDRNAFVASSALMAGLRLFKPCPEIVRRWINEVQEAVNSSSDMVQYHALSLLYKIKQHDRLAVSKIVQQLSKGSLRSPLATCLLIRYTSQLLLEDMGYVMSFYLISGRQTLTPPHMPSGQPMRRHRTSF